MDREKEEGAAKRSVRFPKGKFEARYLSQDSLDPREHARESSGRSFPQAPSNRGQRPKIKFSTARRTSYVTLAPTPS